MTSRSRILLTALVLCHLLLCAGMLTTQLQLQAAPATPAVPREEVTIRAREQSTGGHIPIIAMTAYAQAEAQDACRHHMDG